MKTKFLAFALAAVPVPAFAQFYALGTLNVNTPSGNSWAYAAANGMLVGTSSNKVNGVDHGELAYAWTPSGGMQSMGTYGPDPSGHTTSEGLATSNGVGYGYAEKWVGGTDYGTRSFSWDPVHGMQDIGNLGTDSHGRANVNVGLAEGSKAYGVAQVFTGGGHGQSQAFVWDSVNGMQSLGSLSGINGSSTPIAVSNGNLVGVSQTSHGDRAFIWDSVNGMRSLGTLSTDTHGNGLSYARAIDGNMVYGYYDSYVGSVDKGTRAFAWDSVHGMVNIGTFSTNLSGQGNSRVTSASGGLAFGYCEKWVGNSFEGYQSFAWDSAHGMVNVGNLAIDASGYESTQLTGSDNGVAFGNAHSASAGPDHAVIWDPVHGLTDLHNMLSSYLPTGWTLMSTDAMKDGWIYGRALTPNGIRAWAYYPVPEPASFAAVSLGLFGVLARKRKK